MKIERRYVQATDLEIRADEDQPFAVRGHAATFNEPYNLGPFDEQIDPGAFDESIEGGDVRALWNHDSSLVLGRTKSGTLKLTKDERGLVSDIEFPKSAVAFREAIERGDVDQMSFGFRVPEGGDKWEERDDGRELRTILRAELFDVSPVAFPANPNTDLSIAQRSLETWKDEHAPEPEGPTPEERERVLQLHEFGIMD